MIPKKIAFVIPWYGETISGGAEQMLRDLVHHLTDAGVPLEILTTCVKSFGSNWNRNYHKAGLAIENGIPVRRFRVRRRNARLFNYVNAKVMKGAVISPDEEAVFMREMVNSPDMYAYIRDHREEYCLFFFLPYMFGTTWYGAQICPEKTVLIPCLHDEFYAYFSVIRKVFSRVKGMVFLSEPERRLAEKLYGVKGDLFRVIGTGVSTFVGADADRFREKYGISGPFVLYAGRKDVGKRVDILVRYFLMHKAKYPSDLKLVLIGGGKVETYKSRDIVDLGFVSAEDKYDAYAAADVFCNPSEFESFSIVIMESWLTETPVLVNADCAVTKDFAIRANAGLYYSNAAEFSSCLRYLLDHPDAAAALGKNGRQFVEKEFSWERIVEKYLDFIHLAAPDSVIGDQVIGETEK